MTVLPQSLLPAVSAAGRQLQPAHAAKLATAMCSYRHPGNHATLIAAVPSPGFAATVRNLIEAWEASPEVDGAILGAAVMAASRAHDDARRQPSIEVVVSGPSSPALHARRTEQVLCQLVSEAHEELILLTYSLSMYADLREVLQAAIARGVHITVLAEDPIDNKHYAGDPGSALAGLAVTRLRWPAELRPKAWASMHAKVVVVDRAVAFLTSANLSEVAGNDSLEAGLLLRGGDVPARLAEHLDRLRAEEILRTT